MRPINAIVAMIEKVAQAVKDLRFDDTQGLGNATIMSPRWCGTSTWFYRQKRS
ncbi:MAG TPA: hypothetical protein VF278_11100 [Pirellulales bacterium]